MKTNARFAPPAKRDKTELLATVTWRTGQRTKMGPATEFDLLGTAEEIGKEVGRRLALRHYQGERFKGRIEINWRTAPADEAE